MADKNKLGENSKTVPNDYNEEPKKKLTAFQLKRMKNNQQKALQLRTARVANVTSAENAISRKEVHVISQPIDTGGGFFIEQDDPDNLEFESRPLVQAPAPLFSGDQPICLECKQEFNDSFLQTKFGHNVCDSCRDNDDLHCLISKTDAKKEYLLKDCDIDKREPPLKYILRKNPHNKHGNMKLYLRLQVEERALVVFGSEEHLEEMREQREEAQVQRKQKAFGKKMKALRMEVRSSLYRKKDASHTHSYGPEVYNEDEDMYEKICATCGHKLEYEKM